RFAMPAENDTAVVRNIESLVCVERPGVRHFNAVASFSHRWQHARPKTECAVDMNPRARTPSVFANLTNGIDRSGIYVASLGNDQRRFIQFRHLISSHASLIVHWNKLDVFGSESEHRNRFVDRCVRIGAGDDTNFRSAVKTLAGNVPATSAKQFVATGTQP